MTSWFYHIGCAYPDIPEVRSLHFFFLFVFFYQGFLSQTLTIHRTAVEGRGPSFIPLYHLHQLTKLRHLFATLHARWLSRIFNCNAMLTRLLLNEIYHLIGLPFDWLVDDGMFTCLLDKLFLGFLLQRFDMANRWIWTRIDYHPCIKSEPTNQVCQSPHYARSLHIFALSPEKRRR